jgi:hypothetical protein
MRTSERSTKLAVVEEYENLMAQEANSTESSHVRSQTAGINNTQHSE